MRVRSPTRAEWIVLCVTGGLLAALLIPSPQSVFDGFCTLTVKMEIAPGVDESTILFATYWFDQDADRSVRSPGVYRNDFFRPAVTESQSVEFKIPTMGRTAEWFRAATYNHPKYLVVEYKESEGESGKERPVRKLFPIPTCRRSQSMLIALP
jgi:hypothetical protein